MRPATAVLLSYKTIRAYPRFVLSPQRKSWIVPGKRGTGWRTTCILSRPNNNVLLPFRKLCARVIIIIRTYVRHTICIVLLCSLNAFQRIVSVRPHFFVSRVRPKRGKPTILRACNSVGLYVTQRPRIICTQNYRVNRVRRT